MTNPLNMKRYVYEAFVNFHNETSISSLMENEATVSQSLDSRMTAAETSYSGIYGEIVSAFGSVSNNAIIANEYVASSSSSQETPRGPNSSNMNADAMYSTALLSLYFNAYLSGLVNPTLRSEPLSETEQQSPPSTVVQKGVVNRLVGANFWNMYVRY